ncbi:Calcineurin-like phosphoesterase domain, ApaH type [Dillenia turbinata]|uniref:Calcineurin-like phosphoesterase domain, ApaH type n=1 Tax=Dillenia turbinata TaxID=194707 RepID=A0AAN8VGR4_9MAGN
MASFSLNSLPVPHPPTRKLTDSSSATLRTRGLKPIVVSGNPPTLVSAPGRRIVAVGDLHGDLAQTRLALEMAGILSSDGQDSWIGGETVLPYFPECYLCIDVFNVLVQLGDILDRGEDEIAILSLLRSLDIQAKAQGGAVFQVNGNHETMNVEGDFRYVDSGGFDECLNFLEYLEDYGGNWDEGFRKWIGSSERWKEEQKIPQNYWDPWNLVKRQKGAIARSILLRPGGLLACELARHAVVLQVDDWVFCHGGLLPHHVAYGIGRMNREVSDWMRCLHESDTTPHMPFIATRGYDSVVWNRLFSRDTSDLDDYQVDQASDLCLCFNIFIVSLLSLSTQELLLLWFTSSFRLLLHFLFFLLNSMIQSILEETLQSLGAKAMVVGHTPQMAGVNCKYNCNIWRVDVGMSRGVLYSSPEVLEIIDNKARVIRSKRDTYNELRVVDYT